MNIYPEIKVECKNKKYAEILSNSYAGVISEETALHEYSFQYNIVMHQDKALAEDLLKISITEMRHSSILGKLIFLLGSNPQLICYNTLTNSKIPWTSSYVNYSTNIRDILINNIKSEYLAIAQYKKSIQLIEDIYIKNILQIIINDELKHISILKSYLNKKRIY